MSPPLLFDLAGKRVYVAGHKGMMGSAIVRRLAAERAEILAADRPRSISPISRPPKPGWRACGRMQFSWPPAWSAASTPTTPSRPISSRTIWRSRSMSSAARTRPASGSCWRSAHRASIRSWRRSR